MKFIYPAVIKKQADGTFYGYLPDLKCCEAAGADLEDCLDNCNDAARDWLELELSEDDCDLPKVSDEADMHLKEGEFVRQISVNIRFYEGWDE